MIRIRSSTHSALCGGSLNFKGSPWCLFFLGTAIKTSHFSDWCCSTAEKFPFEREADPGWKINRLDTNLALKVYLLGFYWLKWNIDLHQLMMIPVWLILLCFFVLCYLYEDSRKTFLSKTRRKSFVTINTETQNHFYFLY